MLLCLLRHAEAEASAASDRPRRLTPQGEEQAARAARFVCRHGIAPDLILTSPVTRARQTAQAMAARLPEPRLVEVPWASCGMDPHRAIEELGGFANFATVMLVGHQPDLGALASALLGLPRPQALRMRKGLLAGIRTGAEIRPGAGELQFFIPAKLMD